MTSGEERRARGWWLVGRGAIGLGAAASLWVFIFDREVAHWHDGPLKSSVRILLAAGLVALAVVPIWRRWRGPWTSIAALVLALLGAVDLRSAWFQQQYAVDTSASAPIDLFHPITTTDLRLRHYDVAAPGLGLARLRVLHLTDLHLTEALPASYYLRVQRDLGAREPDLLFITGDSVSSVARLPLLTRFLSTLPRARYGNFGVLGNHEHWLDRADEINALHASAGVTMLGGRCVVVPIPGSPGVRLCGSEAPWGPGLEDETIRSEAPGESPLLVLTHTPDNVYDLKALGAAAVFAGHTHGGQGRLPFFGALVVPSRYGRRFDVGHFDVEGTGLFVSAGIGADAPPFRVYCPPELLEVDFRR